jgi:Endosomal/lysosomal potassium channel TMEM175
MTKGRLEAFSDGVIAIIITIMVLEMKVPHGDRLKELVPLVPTFLSYVLSFIYVGIYWNNHHHMLHAATAVTGAMMWANLYLLFWPVAIPVRHRMDGGEPFHRCAYRALWGGVVDGRDRLPRASASDHSRPRTRFNSQKGSRARLERKGIISAVCRGDPCNVTCNLDRSGDLCVGCADLADSGPAYRKTPCHLNS